MLVLTKTDLRILTSAKKGVLMGALAGGCSRDTLHAASQLHAEAGAASGAFSGLPIIRLLPPAATLLAATLLQPLADRCQSDVGLKLELLIKPKQEDGAAQMQQLVDTIKAAEPQPIVGHLPKDKHEGKVSAGNRAYSG